MIEQVALRIAHSIKNSNPQYTASVDVLKYGLIIILNFCSTLLLCTIVGLLSGKLIEVFIGLLAFIILRSVSGGFHFRTALMCTIVSTLIFTILPFLTLSNLLFYIFMSVSCVLQLLFSPSRIKGKSNIPEKYYPALKVASLLIVSANFIINSDLVALIFLVQSLTLIYLPKGRRE